MNKQEIINFIEKNSFQQLDGDLDEMDDNELQFTTREHGDVGAERHSPIDFKDAQDIGIKAMAEFGIKGFDVEPCDEWVNLTLILK